MAKDQKAELLLDAADSPFTADPLLHAPIDSVRGAKAKAERLSSTGTLAGPARLLRCPELLLYVSKVSSYKHVVVVKLKAKEQRQPSFSSPELTRREPGPS